MKLELHHVAMLCDDLEESLRFYRDTLCLCVVARFYQEGRFDVALLSDRSTRPSFLLALHGRPLDGWSKEVYDANGAQLSALSFLASDVDGWGKKLSHSQPEIRELAPPFVSARVLSTRDPSGVQVNLLNFADPALTPRATALSRSASRGGASDLEYWLSSVSLNCRNTAEVATEKQFYTEELKLSLIRDNPDLMMLADGRPTPHAGLDLFVSEQRVWEPDGVSVTQREPGLHYLCFRVPDLNAAHRDLTQRGVPCTLEPTVAENYDIANYRDPSGIDLSLSTTPWPEWGDGFRDTRDPADPLAGS